MQSACYPTAEHVLTWSRQTQILYKQPRPDETAWSLGSNYCLCFSLCIFFKSFFFSPFCLLSLNDVQIKIILKNSEQPSSLKLIFGLVVFLCRSQNTKILLIFIPDM